MAINAETNTAINIDSNLNGDPASNAMSEQSVSTQPRKSSITRTARKWLLAGVCAIPAVALTTAAVQNALGPDPAKALALETGEWAIRFLLVTLAITPLQRWQRLRGLVAYRRILGVVTWVYACLHFLVYLAFLLAWQWGELGEELIERPYIMVGFVGLLLLTPLAITSNNFSVRKLKNRWRTLHKLIYPIAILAAIHVLWQIRSDSLEALVYAGIIAVLLLSRYIESRRKARKR